MRRKALIVVLCLLLSSSWTVNASSNQGARTSAAFAAHLSVLDLTLGKSTLDDVKTKLGEATASKSGQGGDSVNELCYTPHSRGEVKVVFQSGAAGGWTELTGFRLMSARAADPLSRSCSLSPHMTESPRTAGGLRLGLSRSKVLRLLGPPSRTKGSTVVYVSHSQTRANGARVFDVQTIIEVTFDDAKASIIAVYHTITN
jgi:hypothetical protein